MSAIVGSWDIEMNSPIGKQAFTIELTATPTPEGSATGPEGRVKLEDVALDGDTASFVIAVDKPIKIRSRWRLTATGDQIAGTVKAGVFPAVKAQGRRAGSATDPAGEPEPVAEAPVLQPAARIATRAAVLRSGDGAYAVEEVQIDPPGPGQVLVRVAAAGMCHTDAVARQIWSGPVILGHEGAGVVETVGPGVTGVAAGDHVVLSFDSCGHCPGCRAGRPYDCVEFEARNFAVSADRAPGAGGVQDADGEPIGKRWFGQSSFAGYSLATERNVVPVDPGLPLEVLAPLGCGLMTGAGSVLNVMQLRPGERIAIFGAGAVGLSAVMAASASGAGEIVVADLHPGRRDLALELGAHRTIDPAAVPDLAEPMLDDGDPFNYSFDTTARESVMTAAVDVIGRPGLCVLVGAGFETVTLLPSALAGKTITYAYMGHADPHAFIPRLIGLWQQGRFPFDRLITTFPLDRIDDAERASASGAALKPVLLAS